MAALAANFQWAFDITYKGDYENHNGIASDIFYEGALIAGNGSGAAKPLAGSDTVFLGVCVRKFDNATGAADTLKRVRVLKEALVRGAAVTGAAATTEPGTTVYAVDDGTLTLASTGNLAVGKVTAPVGTNLADVFLQATSLASL